MPFTGTRRDPVPVKIADTVRSYNEDALWERRLYAPWVHAAIRTGA